MKIRLQDIADELNLSKMTISKVLRGQADVSAETKARVLKRVEELKYRPNLSARSLRTGLTYSVGLVLPGMEGSFPADLCRGILEVLQPANYAVILSLSNGDPEVEEREAELHLSRQVDALFLVRQHSSSAPETLRDSKVPVVYLGGRPPGTTSWSVTLRETEVGKFAAQHLLSRGARRIAYLRGPRTVAADERFSGFLAAHQQAALSPRRELIAEVRQGDAEYAGAFQLISTMLQQRSTPDAVMANTDTQAAGARDAALQLGLNVPGAFQVIGCGNEPYVRAVGQQLTTVDLRGAEIGVRAAQVALQELSDAVKTPPRAIVLSPRILPGATTRPHETAPRKERKA